MAKTEAVDLQKAFKTKKRSGIKKKVVRDMHAEMNAAAVHHGWAMTPLNPQMPDAQKLVVLAEEIGEVAEEIADADGMGELAQRMNKLATGLGRVARAMTYDHGDQEQLYQELIQVMTMSGAWAQSLRAANPKGWVS